MYVIEQPTTPAPAADSAANVLAQYVLKMKGYDEQLECLGYVLPRNLNVGLILNDLTSDFAGLPKKAATPQVKTIQGGRIQKANKKLQKAKGKGKGKGKGKDKSHWKRNCPIYLAELMKNKKQVDTASSSGIFTIELFSFPNKSWVYETSCGTHICITKQCLRGARKLEQGDLYLYIGNGVHAHVEAIGSFELVLPNGLVICLDNYHYAPTITRDVVSVSCLVDNGFIQRFIDYGILVSKNDVLYFNVIFSNGIYEIDMSNLVPNVNYIYNVSSKRVKHNLDFTYLWHFRLAHISKKRIGKLQHDGLLKSTNDESFDKCVSCVSGKMTRKSFPHRPERATDLLGLIHTDVCGPLRHVSRQGAGYFNTFTDDYSRYGYIYLLKHKHVFHETFKDYALESAACILNMVLTKKVDKTPYELWYGKVSNLSYLKVWGCEALMKRDTPNKLQQRSVKCISIGYPNETMGYYFYFPPKNKIVVARYAELYEKNLLSQEVSGRAGDLEEIQDEDTSPSEITSEIPMEVEGFEPPHKEEAPVRRPVRTHRALVRLCLNVEAEEHSLGDLNEPANYKTAMLDLESNKWLNGMNAEMQSIKDNQVWVLVKWIFKKKTNMDGIVYTYKARHVAKGYTQLYGVDYEETFSPIADIKPIRILIAIVAFYDYEIWQMDVKTTFLNGYLDEYIYIVQPKGEAAFILGIKIYRDRSKRLIGLSQSAYMNKILCRFNMDTSKNGYILMQERLDLNKTQGDSTPGEVKRMQNVPYASAVGSIMHTNPGEPQWSAVKTILKYLRNTKDMFLVYGGNPEAELQVQWTGKAPSKVPLPIEAE
ncbi:retrotransposon protein, putative, ty1-copia subclass [Tanacetum coccineum]